MALTKEELERLVRENPDQTQVSLARELFKQGLYHSVESARHAIRYRNGKHTARPIPMTTDKKIGSVNWREMAAFATEAKRIRSEAGWSQSHANVAFDTDKPLGIVMLSDLHALSYGTDHTNLVNVIDEIMETPNLMIGLVGDLIQMSINMRSVQEVGDNILAPDMQMEFLESFIDEIADRVVFATWDNHAVTREEKQSGVSMFKRILSRRVVYFNGIGHVDVKVGAQVYKLAVTHKVRGRSMLNPIHGQQRYMRFEGIDREITIAGDSHTPGISQYTDGALTRLAVNCGALQTSSGYAQRYFSLYTHPIFPIVTLRPDRHEFSGDWTLAAWKERTFHPSNN